MCFILSNFSDFQVTFASNIYDINNKNKPLTSFEINKYFIFLRFYLFILERGEGREKEREKHWCVRET